MPWLMQMVWFGLLFLGIAFALWVGIWVLLALFLLGVAAVCWAHLRDFLVAKGILNPNLGRSHRESETTTTLIEGDFTRVDNDNDTRIP
jgi:hypothetical protein